MFGGEDGVGLARKSIGFLPATTALTPTKGENSSYSFLSVFSPLPQAAAFSCRVHIQTKLLSVQPPAAIIVQLTFWGDFFLD